MSPALAKTALVKIPFMVMAPAQAAMVISGGQFVTKRQVVKTAFQDKQMANAKAALTILYQMKKSFVMIARKVTMEKNVGNV